MKKILLATAIAAISGSVLASSNGVRFEREIKHVNGITIDKELAHISMKGEHAGERGEFTIVSNHPSGHESVMFDMQESAAVQPGDVTYTVDGSFSVRHKETRDIRAGKHHIGAHMHHKTYADFKAGDKIESIVTITLLAPTS
ncbi:hypothetical protein [Vibrio sp. 10N]|uniref:hypothetical protein n=1 Tax=Vibrio sp. 10N TaxID=3058938 RepID=UPI0028135BEA|nr:hypothetical protein VB10N_40290 [Vibrio sp. 10N]